ncbi:MAG: hypothetical protein KatS3mg040_0319 [Candidatus Kapaibacterium sp.]|nr:MAG: hypothetical protein KatS3mg040_0319 [Candidatus Kapabacteria bacterium]
MIETVVATSCTGSATYGPVTVISSPTPSISRTSPPGPLGQACVGQTITYETPPSGNSYQWSVTGGGSIVGASNNNSVQIQWSATGTQTITLVETQGSCSTTVTQQVNVVAQPSPVVSGPAVACSGSDFSYTYSTANNTGSSYNWTLGTGVNAVGATTNASVVVTFLNSTANSENRTLSVTETNSANCSATSSTYNVSVTSTPQPNITGTTPVCQNATATYSDANAASQPPATTYSWSVTGGTITGAATGSSVTVLWNSAGSQTVTLVATNNTNSANCSKTATFNVVVDAAPTVYNVGTTTPTACSNVSNNVTITLSGSQSGVTYTINRSPDGVQVTLNGTGNPLSFTQTVSTAGTYQYTITASDGTCTSTMNGTATVVVTDPPTATVSGPSDVCSGSSATYTATPTSGVTYAWSVSGSGNSVQSTTANQATILFGVTSGTATVTVVVTNSSGCQGTATQNVTVNALPLNRPVAISPSAICAAGGVGTNVTSATVTVGSQAQPVQANTTYQLLLGSSVVATQTTGGSPPDAITFTVGGLSAGTYVYSVRAISSTTPACTTVMTQTASLTVNALPTPAVTGNTTPCVGQTVTYTTQNNTGSSYAWTWTPGADFTAAGPVNTYQLTGSWGASGSKSVTVTETNSAGCGQSNTLNVTVSSQIAATVSGPSDVCSGSSATYTATPTSGVTYAWSVSGSGNSVQSTTANQATILFGVTSGTETVTVVVTDGNGCQGTAAQSVTVHALPLDRPVAISPSAICAAGGVGTNVTSATITVGSACATGRSRTRRTSCSWAAALSRRRRRVHRRATRCVTFTVGEFERRVRTCTACVRSARRRRRARRR